MDASSAVAPQRLRRSGRGTGTAPVLAAEGRGGQGPATARTRPLPNDPAPGAHGAPATVGSGGHPRAGGAGTAA